MKKILIGLVGLFGVFVAPILAQPTDASAAKKSGLFIGLEGGFALSWTYLDTILVDDDGDKYSGYIIDEYDDYSDSVFNYGVKAGWYFRDSDMRVYAMFEKNTKAEDTDYDIKFSNEITKVLIGYDAAVVKISENSRLLTGVNLGYAKLKSIVGDHSASYNGIDFGGKVGILYDINNNNEIEFGLKVNCSVFEEKKAGERKIGNTYYDVDILPIQVKAGLYVGYNYKF
ncbi:MAG: hypothetical protein LBH45_03660 [Campylobacteraceae bacterium]|nr:hypothetical protein [Campylobacteraceae bacterium]